VHQVADREEESDMIPGNHDVTLTTGDTFRLFFRARAKNPDGSPGAYFNFTGKFPKAQLRSSTGTLLAEFTATLGDQVNYPGSILLRLGPITTEALTPGSGNKYDVQVSSAAPGTLTNADDNDTYLKGSVTIVADVTENV
jgi:hypothetical protein